MSQELVGLLHKSGDLDRDVSGLIGASYPDVGRRFELALTLCCVSLEHGHSLKALLGIGNLTSAASLLRLQYESLVRAMWVAYAAHDAWVEKLGSQLTAESAKQANNLPMLAEMLSQMNEKAPPQAMAMLGEFKDYSWKALSSFVHGGIHAIDRHERGYPEPLIEQALRASNGVLVMAGMMIVVLSRNPALEGVIPDIQTRYSECLPPAAKADS